MANAPYGVETLRKISIVWVGRTNVTDDRRQTDRRWHIANMNLSSRSLKKVAIANTLQLEAAEPRQPFPDLITTPCQVWRHWTYPLPYFSVFAANTLLYAVTLTFDLWPWTYLQHIVCDVMKLCTKFECNRTIRGGVIAISVFDLMTLKLNMF